MNLNNEVTSSASLKEFTVIHNIPSPYRLHLFTVMDRLLHHRGMALHVHFMSPSHVDRPHWQPHLRDIPFAHSFWRDFGPIFRGTELHFNPGLIRAVCRRRSHILMVGGPWASFTGLLVSTLTHGRYRIAWLEANRHVPGHITGIWQIFKKAVLNSYNCVAVPGVEGERHIQLLWGASSKPPRVITLPNLVDETRFFPRRSEDEEQCSAIKTALGLANDRKLAVLPARLIPKKGIREFLYSFKSSDLNGWDLAILGEGPLYDQISATCSDLDIRDHVHIMRYLPYEQMPLLYRAANLFVLPSLQDPSPLSVVEAIQTGLPLLVSNRIGNLPEVLEEGTNGWSFNPYDITNTKIAVEHAFRSSTAELREMGERSYRIAVRFWGSEATIERFLDSIPIAK